MAKLSNQQKVDKYLKIEKNHIYAKYDLIIRIDNEEMKVGEEELVNTSSDENEELQGSISIPGMLNIEIPSENDEIQLYFPFDVNLISNNASKNKNLTTYSYDKDELVCFANTKSSATDIMILDKLFENRVKYLRGDLPKHIIAIYDQLINTKNIQMHHIETLLTVLYGEDTSEGFSPTRLASRKYSKKNALSSKDSAHKFNSSVGFNYGYTKDVVADNISRKYDTEKTDLEKVIAGNFDELGK